MEEFFCFSCGERKKVSLQAVQKGKRPLCQKCYDRITALRENGPAGKRIRVKLNSKNSEHQKLYKAGLFGWLPKE